jgi:hypothetical protein
MCGQATPIYHSFGLAVGLLIAGTGAEHYKQVDEQERIKATRRAQQNLKDNSDIEGRLAHFDNARLCALLSIPRLSCSPIARGPYIYALRTLNAFSFAAVKRMKQLAVPGGIMLLAVPTGKDQLHWNIHRVYGRARLPLLLSSWKVEGIFGDEHVDTPSLSSRFISRLFRFGRKRLRYQPRSRRSACLRSPKCGEPGAISILGLWCLGFEVLFKSECAQD